MARPKHDGERWTPQDVSILRRDAKDPNISTNDIADKLGRTEEAVQQKAHRLDISLKVNGEKRK